MHVIGAVFGYVTAVFEPFNIPNLRRGAGVGVLAGFLTFSALFIPITRFEIEPSLLGTLKYLSPRYQHNRITK
jgi:fluoride ion exporter CrcB/FEX